MKPPFSYYGGKQKIVKHIIPHIPQHTVFVEPFAGGATLLFAKPDYRTGNNNNYREVINDTNKDVHNFFVQLRDNGTELCRMLELSLYSQEEHRIARNYNGDDPLMKAYYFYVNIMQSFAKIINGSWGNNICGQNIPITNKNKTDNLQLYIERMRSIYISCEDAIQCIKRWDSPQTFFYCDPPYPETRQEYGKTYTQQDFENLIETLDSCEGSFILSCYHNEAVPKDWQKYEFETRTSSSNTAKDGHREKRTECIWIRQATKQPRPEILKIYDKQNQLYFA